MFRAELLKSISAPWTAMQPIEAGKTVEVSARPGVYVAVHRNDEPFARIDVWPQHQGVFSAALVWKNRVAVGWEDQVHLIDAVTRHVKSIACDGYFGHLYAVGDRLLIATATTLICLDDSAHVLWESDWLGIDGVIVDEVGDGVIYGQGEWDPPGGWRPFQVLLASGKPFQNA